MPSKPNSIARKRGAENSKGNAAMALTLYYHPLSSFCHKVLIALYENDTPFTPYFVDLGDQTAAANFKKIWPIGKFPVLHDDTGDRMIPESSIIIEYLAQHYPGKSKLVPADADLARQMRMRDRFFDLYVHMQMQKVIGDRLRPEGKHDPHGVEDAKATLRTSLGMLEQELATKAWIMGDTFTMADCAAAPALFYANMVMPFGETHKNVMAYLERLKARPSYARALKEAEPYMSMVPK
jgi:glutathione S-transferase